MIYSLWLLFQDKTQYAKAFFMHFFYEKYYQIHFQ